MSSRRCGHTSRSRDAREVCLSSGRCPRTSSTCTGSTPRCAGRSCAATGYVVPYASFFVRNQTSTPLIDAGTWSMRVIGTGLRGSVTANHAVWFSYQYVNVPASLEIFQHLSARAMSRRPTQPRNRSQSPGNGDGQSLKPPSSGYLQPGVIALSLITAGHRAPQPSVHHTVPAVSCRRKTP